MRFGLLAACLSIAVVNSNQIFSKTDEQLNRVRQVKSELQSHIH